MKKQTLQITVGFLVVIGSIASVFFWYDYFSSQSSSNGVSIDAMPENVQTVDVSVLSGIELPGDVVGDLEDLDSTLTGLDRQPVSDDPIEERVQLLDDELSDFTVFTEDVSVFSDDGLFIEFEYED